MDRLPENVSRWIKERQIILEIILAALVLLTAALKFRNMTGADDAFILAMLALASFYFLTAFLHRQESKVVIIVTQVFQIASSVSVIGLLFTFMRLPGAREQLLIGLLSMAACALIIIFLAVKGHIQKFLPMLIRVIVLGGLSLDALLGLGNLPVD